MGYSHGVVRVGHDLATKPPPPPRMNAVSSSSTTPLACLPTFPFHCLSLVDQTLHPPRPHCPNLCPHQCTSGPPRIVALRPGSIQLISGLLTFDSSPILFIKGEYHNLCYKHVSLALHLASSFYIVYILVKQDCMFSSLILCFSLPSGFAMRCFYMWDIQLSSPNTHIHLGKSSHYST